MRVRRDIVYIPAEARCSRGFKERVDRVGGWCKTELYGARRPVDREIVLERRAEFRLRSRERRNCAPYSARASPRVGAKGTKKESKVRKRRVKIVYGYRYGVANARGG